MSIDTRKPASGGASRRAAAGSSGVPLPGRSPSATRSIWVMAVFLVVIGLVVAWIGQSASAVAPLGVSWALHPASNTVTVRLSPGSGPLGRKLMAESYLLVSAAGSGHGTGRMFG